METSQEKIAQAKELLRQAFALLNDIGYTPNVRVSHAAQIPGNVNHEPYLDNLRLIAAHVEPGPVVPVEPEIRRIPEPIEADE